MLSEYEARKLCDTMHHELNAGPAAVWRCIAGLLIVIGLSVLAPGLDPRVDPSSAVAQAREPDRMSLARTRYEEE
jgi:hypothetical protein